ncbi:hypothetical protein [Pseudomonas nitroreducens]|uniref:Uncharacterized protein n=1 Tax=Pseudomonas nitroreducens TaxID=46680 RepID=A0A2D0ADX2_PSENT|nr:hypothetical protein [Pseudomonas nitroreducens]OWP50279.1 hypothetical protein CEG18_12055 [Pseudomonas nitroreducens]
MKKRNGNVVSLAEVRGELKADGVFLGLLQKDIESNPECIQPIPDSLLQRMAALRVKAQKSRERTELLEG